MLGEIVSSCYAKATELHDKEGYITLKRSFATISLRDADVPFHSRYLWPVSCPSVHVSITPRSGIAHR